jgi:hypothetical protein
MRGIKVAAFVSLLAGGLLAQDSGDKVTVHFSDPARPHLLKAHLTSGAITVRGGSGKDVIVEGRGGGSDRHDWHRDRGRSTEGMRRIDNAGAYDITVEEADNLVTVSTHSPNRYTELLIAVPINTSLKLSVTNGGNITVENVTGEIEVKNTNGGVRLVNVAGSVIAHALNQNVEVSMTKATPDKSMSFTSLNGDIDVTLPADIKAAARLKSDRGEIYSDFDIKMDTNRGQPVIEEGRSGGGRYRIRVEKTLSGVINSGGPEFLFQTFNGNIYIRKAR